MANHLLVLPVDCKNSINPKDKSIIDKISKKYEIFYIENNSSEKLKKYISEKIFDIVIYVYPSIVRDYEPLRIIKSINLQTKIVLLYPQTDNIKNLRTLEKNIYDPVYQLLEKSASMEVSNCQLADFIITSGQDKELIADKVKNIPVSTQDELSVDGIKFNDRPKYLVSIVMLTYNQLEDTKITVESLFKYTQNVNYELIFVDNGSTKDDTKTYLDTLKEEHSNIKVIYNKENLGFATANNQGIEISEGEYVLLLNNDVILTENWLYRMLQIAESNSKIGMVVPCTNHASGRQVVEFDGTEEDEEEIQQFAKTILAKNAGKWISVNRVIGFCMLLKREVLFNVGVLDEMFGPGGYEDYDYCMRIKQAGYDIIIATDNFVFHIGGKGYSSNNMNYSELRGKNIELLIDKWTRNILEIMEKLPNGM